MKSVKVYIKPTCPYCHKALSLLSQKGVEPIIVDIAAQPELRDEMIQISGRKTVPQIFIGDHHVGGCDDLHLLERKGQLDALLAS